MVQDNRKTTEIAYFWTELWSLDLFQCFMRYCGRNLQSISSPASGDKRRQSLPFREGSRETWRAREGLLQWGNRPSEIWRTLMISWILCLDFCSSTGDISWEACWKPCWCSKRGAALDTNHAVLLLGCAGILMDTHRNRWSGQQLCTFFAFIWSTSQLGVVDTHFGRSVAELHTKRFSRPSGQHLSARLHDARGPESCRPRVGFVG